ncbi:glycoside hydrolase family 24 protein [Acidovorax sp. LjRoot194]|uniref:glycoside hydrolase family 24 protein n=1 Tax=Acidovorax sp. LjRoot194 TaxID=3342280 RepID=UPI003ECD2D6D
MTRALYLLAGAVVVLVAVDLARRQAGQGAPEWGGTLPDGWADLVPEWGASEPDQTTTFFEDVIVNLSPSTYAPSNVAPDVAAANVRAFLDMIAYAEGTAGYPGGGYNTLFAGGQFEGFADHPRIYVPFRTTSSSAAGRYQILARTWDGLQGKLNLPDFGPASQDAAAVELIRERGALGDVQAGRTVRAIGKVAKVWASLPGAGYNQPERKLTALLQAYAGAGGTTTEA